MKEFNQINLTPIIENTLNPRIGVVALSTDFTIEQDFRNIFYQQPVNLYVNRIPFDNPMNEKNYLKMKNLLPSIASNLLPGESIDTIAYGCTSGTIAIGEKEVEKQISAVKKNCYVTTPITAALKAFKKLSLNKVAILTPYPELVNKTIFDYFEKKNIDVTSFNSFNIESDKATGSINSPLSVCMPICMQQMDLESAPRFFLKLYMKLERIRVKRLQSLFLKKKQQFCLNSAKRAKTDHFGQKSQYLA